MEIKRRIGIRVSFNKCIPGVMWETLPASFKWTYVVSAGGRLQEFNFQIFVGSRYWYYRKNRTPGTLGAQLWRGSGNSGNPPRCFVMLLCSSPSVVAAGWVKSVRRIQNLGCESLMNTMQNISQLFQYWVSSQDNASFWCPVANHS